MAYQFGSIIFCLLAGFIYSTAIIFSTSLVANLFTLGFITFLVLLFINNHLRKPQPKLLVVVSQAALLNLGIAIALVFFNARTDLLWAPDSLATHLPEALRIVKAFEQGLPLQLGVISGVSTHVVTALFLKIFGTNVFATVLAQLTFKLSTMYIIYKIAESLWSRSIAVSASQIYAFCPTVFFYNLVLYKESAVQFFVALVLLSLVKIFWEKRWAYSSLLLLSTFLLYKERSYLLFLFIPCILMGTYKVELLRRHWIKTSLFNYAAIITIFFVANEFGYSPARIIDFLIKMREGYASFPDVLNKFNYEIPYPLAIVKILFSPYFTPNKFTDFWGFSYLWIWGSFINQGIILMSLAGAYRIIKQYKDQLILWIPFVLFILFSAYISPWSGRLRDSFYPLIACYAAYTLSTLRKLN